MQRLFVNSDYTAFTKLAMDERRLAAEGILGSCRRHLQPRINPPELSADGQEILGMMGSVLRKPTNFVAALAEVCEMRTLGLGEALPDHQAVVQDTDAYMDRVTTIVAKTGGIVANLVRYDSPCEHIVIRNRRVCRTCYRVWLELESVVLLDRWSDFVYRHTSSTYGKHTQEH